MRSEPIYPSTPRDEYPDIDAVEARVRERASCAPKPPPREPRQSDSYFDQLRAVEQRRR